MKRLERKPDTVKPRPLVTPDQLVFIDHPGRTEVKIKPRGRPRKPYVYTDPNIVVNLARFCTLDSVEQLYASLLVNHIMARRPTLREEWGVKCAELTGIKVSRPSRASAVQS
jgi:hypothetical protein